MFKSIHQPPRAVILAGGEGIRLRPLTRLICGDSRPKQFCPLFGSETLLARTRSRLKKAVAPEDTFFAVNKAHKRFYVKELAAVERNRILVQPDNKGTAPAIAYGALRVLDEDRDAVVAFIPADHYYDDDQPFVEALRLGFEIARQNPSHAVLLGAEPDRAETEYGWIEPIIEPIDVLGEPRSLPGKGTASSVHLEGSPPDQQLSRQIPRAVSRFWEKPSQAQAQELLLGGCLWNTFVMIARAETFLNLLRVTVPAMVLAFEEALDGKPALEPDVARHLYHTFPEIDFSRQVLSVCADRLLAIKLAHAGWSDLGKPERVIETLARAGIRTEWEGAELQSSKAIA